jgi:nucleoside-diphosphate-sugar epimerase
VAARLERVVTGNVTNPESTLAIVDLAPDVIFHLAAEAYVPRSFRNPGEVFAANAVGTLHVLEAARRLPQLHRVVVASTAEVYGTADDDRPIDEEHPFRPTSPYGASKVAADRLAYSYWVAFGVPVAVIRPFNTYGPRHTYDVIPKFIQLALAGEDLTVYGDGDQRRDFTYVDDMIAGFLRMGSDPRAVGEAINFGSGRSRSILETAREIIDQSGSGSRVVHGPPRAGEVRHLLCNPAKADRLLGWRPTIALEDGIRRNLAAVRAGRRDEASESWTAA